ncbi:MAG: efflux RND transporter periplasmic adaptor subunit [Ignavibacteriaceae bacterium]|nr:efflux RND transporter periplasmic adaptor subunit [Ignavibacteriaceae bacterium]
MKKYLYLFVIAAGISVLEIGCGNDKAQQKPMNMAVPVSVYKIIPETATYFDNYPATVTPLNQVDLRPEVSGYITDIYFKEGQHVTKGMKLYDIDQRQYKAAYDQSVANLNVAKSNFDKAQQDYNRYSELAKNDAIARQVLEHSEADLQTAKMQVTAAESNVKVVETNFRYSVIYASFDGTIGISQVKLGSSVTAGQTLLNTISSDNPMGVDFSVDEKQINRFTYLMQSKRDSRDSTFSVILPDQTIYPLAGRISFIDRAVDPQTGTIRTRLIFPNPKNILRAGLTCNVRVRNENAEGSILVPFKAVVEQMGEYFVFVVNGNKVSQRKISIGNQENEKVIVKDGLRVGEEIVTEGIQKLKDNSMIALNPPGAKTKPGTTRSY